eukprot:g1873.t1
MGAGTTHRERGRVGKRLEKPRTAPPLEKDALDDSAGQREGAAPLFRTPASAHCSADMTQFRRERGGQQRTEGRHPAEEGEDGDGGRAASNVGVDNHRKRRDKERRARMLEGVFSALRPFSRRHGLGRAGLHASYVNDELGSPFGHSESPSHRART